MREGVREGEGREGDREYINIKLIRTERKGEKGERHGEKYGEIEK